MTTRDICTTIGPYVFQLSTLDVNNVPKDAWPHILPNKSPNATQTKLRLITDAYLSFELASVLSHQAEYVEHLKCPLWFYRKFSDFAECAYWTWGVKEIAPRDNDLSNIAMERFTQLPKSPQGLTWLLEGSGIDKLYFDAVDQQVRRI